MASRSTSPRRKTLPHVPPPGVDSSAPFFVTICIDRSSDTVLTKASIAEPLLHSVRYYNRLHRWHASIFVAMPDHVHMIASFPDEPGMTTTVRSWKRYTARELGIRWQRNFFDHRIRSDSWYQQKAEYIWMNPVRAGFVTSPDQWPWFEITPPRAP